jgi:hypothetical protein
LVPMGVGTRCPFIWLPKKGKIKKSKSLENLKRICRLHRKSHMCM